MSVEECQEKISVREFKVWMYRMKNEFERPSQTDWYLMRVTAEINKLVKLKTNDRSSTYLTDFQLVEKKPTKSKKLTDEDKKLITERAKAMTMARILKGTKNDNDH
jgi:hypothetical protein